MSKRGFVIEVIGKPYEVRFTESPVPNDGLMGRSSIVSSRIWIRDDLEPFAQRQTLLHEIVHMIGDDCSLDLSETQVSVIANGLASVKELRFDFPEDRPSMEQLLRGSRP